MRGTQIDIDQGYIFLSGHTFPHKDSIKSLGGRFCYVKKTWQIPYSEEVLSKLKDAGAQLPLHASALVSSPHEIEPLETFPPVRPAQLDGLGVRDLLEKIEFSLKTAFASPVWVIGEVMNLAVRERATFFSFSEEKSERSQGTLSIKAIYWRKSAILQDGVKVRALCKVELYKDRGEISLQVLEIDENFTKGLIHLEREKVIKSLMKKGIFTKQKNLIMPFLPQRIGLITAKGSRALSDFLDQLNPFCGEVFIHYATMQGEQTSQGIAHALHYLRTLDLDLVVITRGGGSSQDLRWFDDEALAETVCLYPIPVLAAIGHHEDTCVLEMVSHLREKTPTAAADFLLRRQRNVVEFLDQRRAQMIKNLEFRFHFFREKLTHLKVTLTKAEMRAIDIRKEYLGRAIQRLNQSVLLLFKDRIFYLDRMKKRIVESALLSIQLRKDKIQRLEKDLISKDPRDWMMQGWTQLVGDNGDRIQSVREMKEGQKLRARLLDGQVDLSVEKIKKM